ncbi:MAG: hypothetical protein WBM16_19065 [Pseudolabrys sp.]
MPISLVVVVVLGLCPPLLGGWFAQSSGNWDLFERSGSMTAAIGLVVASRRYFQYGVHELAVLRADEGLKSDMAELLEDVLTAKMGLALSAFGTIVSGWGKYLGWWSFSYLLVWAWFTFRDIYRDSIRLKKSRPGAAASDTPPGG